MNAREREFVGAEFAALGAEVLCAGVEPVDLLVGGVRDQGDLADVVVFGELRPCLDYMSPNEVIAYLDSFLDHSGKGFLDPFVDT
jgi:hypothetical protein